METSKRARRRKPETAETDLKPPLIVLGRAGRLAIRNPKGFKEKHRAVIDGSDPDDVQVGQRWGEVELARWGRRRHSFAPSRQGVCGRRDAEDSMRDPRRPGCVAATSRVSDPITASEAGSDARA